MYSTGRTVVQICNHNVAFGQVVILTLEHFNLHTQISINILCLFLRGGHMNDNIMHVQTGFLSSFTGQK